MPSVSSSPVASVGFLAPMPSELRPLVPRLGLSREGKDHRAWHTGRLGDVALVATTTGIGTARATEAATRLLEWYRVDHVVVTGVAGGLSREAPVGSVVVPETVVDARGTTFRPTPLDGGPGRGSLLTTDELIKDRERLDDLVRRGFVAVDMETAAVAAVCEAASVPWSVYRGISDDAFDPGVDDAVLGLTRPDGSADLGRVARFVLARPSRVRLLARLGKDLSTATKRAADAAASALERSRRPERG